MKKNIGKVTGMESSGGSIRFLTEGGRLLINVVSEKIISVEYGVDGYKVPEYLDEASKNLFSCGKQDIVPEIFRTDAGWAVTAGRTVVRG